MNNYDERQILSRVLDCGVCDVDFLINNINDYGLDFDDIKEESEMIFGNSNDVNSLIYATFNMAAGNFLAEANNLFVDKELGNRVDQDLLEDFDMNIYTNYLDSGFDSILSEYNLNDLSESNLQGFLEELYDDEYLFLDKEEMLEIIEELKYQIEHTKDDKDKENKIKKLKQYSLYNDDDISYAAIDSLSIVEDDKDFNAFDFIDKRNQDVNEISNDKTDSYEDEEKNKTKHRR